MGKLVKIDVIEGASLDFNLTDGNVVNRVCIVNDLSGNADQRLQEAKTTAGVPQRGEFHPTIPFIQVISQSVEPLGAETARVTVTYKQLLADQQEPDEKQLPIISIGATVQQSTTTRDANGNTISVLYKFTDRSTGEVKEKNPVAQVERQFPQVVFSLQRKEPRPPIDKAKQFVGTINKRNFFQDPNAFWLCTRLSGTSQDGGISYTVDYEFQRNPETWDALVLAFDEGTGKPFADIKLPEKIESLARNSNTLNGVKRVQIYVEEDFQKLDVDITR